MEFLGGLAIGLLLAGIFNLIGKAIEKHDEKTPISTQIHAAITPRGKVKRVPKSISDAEIVKREQNQPPRDPS